MDLLALRTRTSIPIFVATGAALLVLAVLPVVRAQESGQPQYTIRQRVPLTIVDVTVTDDKGHPVHGLHQSEFTLLEDGQPMALASFDEHRTDTAVSAAPTPALILPPNTFTNALPTSPNPTPVTILVIDNTNTPTGTQLMVQKQMLNFVTRMPPGTRVGVFRLSDSLAIVQGITADKELLKAAILDKKNLTLAPRDQDIGQDPADIADHAPPMPNDPCDETDTARTSARAEATLSTMRQLARYLSGIPGRKNVIWFSGSFPPASPENVAAGAKLGECYDFRDALNTATDLLARAHVALNPIESRGLPPGLPSRKMLDEHYNMDLRAEQTGGHAVYASNDLAGAAQAALDAGSNFYTLTYTPTNQTLDTRFRKIAVKVAQPNLHLTYRTGYYAVDPAVDSRGKPIETVTPMQSALMRGALDSTQILFNVKVAQAPGTEPTLPATNIPDAKQMHPPYRRYSIAYTIDAHNLEFAPSPDGNYRANFEYGVNVYSPDGDQILNSASKVINPVLPPVVYHSMLKSGAGAHLDIDVPATGEYFLRIAVHDLASDRTGSIEIPVSSISSATSAAPTSTPPPTPNPPTTSTPPTSPNPPTSPAAPN